MKSWKGWRDRGREGKKEGRMLATRESLGARGVPEHAWTRAVLEEGVRQLV